MGLKQERHQDIQDFMDQYVVLCKVCSELGLRFGHSDCPEEEHQQTKIWKINGIDGE